MDDAEPNIITAATPNGEVEAIFKLPDGKHIRARFAAADAGMLSSQLLASAYQASVVLNDGPAASPETLAPDTIAIPVTKAGIATLPGRNVMVLCVGATKVAFGVEQDKFAGMANNFMLAFWRSLPPPSIKTAIKTVLKNVRQDLVGFYRVVEMRAGVRLRRYRKRLVTFVTGRSLRIFCSSTIDPDAGPREYKAVGRCIYCDSEIYAKGNSRKLGGEHIIAEGLGGNIELLEASCLDCERITGALVEGDVLGNTLKAFRLHLKIRGKKRPPPDTLPLPLFPNGPTIDLAIEDYPVVFGFPLYDEPQLFVGGPGGTQPVADFVATLVKYDPIKVARKYGILQQWSTPRWDSHMLFRMLAKSAHAFAQAEIPGKFKPVLSDLIRHGTTDAFNHIGGERTLPPPTDALHEIGLGYRRVAGKDYVVARIRLFARHGGPVYYVVVGESLESRMAKLRRRFSKRSSRMHSR